MLNADDAREPAYSGLREVDSLSIPFAPTGLAFSSPIKFAPLLGLAAAAVAVLLTNGLRKGGMPVFGGEREKKEKKNPPFEFFFFPICFIINIILIFFFFLETERLNNRKEAEMYKGFYVFLGPFFYSVMLCMIPWMV